MAKRKADLRRSKRERKRLRVRFWNEDGVDGVGFTLDVSESGLFVESPADVEVGTRIHLELSINDKPFFVEGVVARKRAVHRAMNTIVRAGFGVRFVGLGEAIKRVRSGPTHSDDGVLRVDLRDEKELAAIYERDLKLGVITIQTDSPPAVDTSVTVCLILPDPSMPVVVNGVVSAVMPKLPGIGVKLAEPDQIRGLVSEILAYKTGSEL